MSSRGPNDPAGVASSGRLEPTWTQKLLAAGQALHPHAPLYNMALAFEIQGPLDPKRFVDAFRGVVHASDALRSVFEEGPDGTSVRVLEPFEAAVERVNLTGSDDPEEEARRWVEARASRTLGVAGPLFDCALLELRPNRWMWFLNQHHLITDAWAAALVFRWVSQRYADLGVEPAPAPSWPPPYAEYARALGALRDTPAGRGAREHWSEVVRSGLEPVRLYGRGGSVGHSTRTERTTIDLGPDRSEALRRLASEPEARGLTEHASRFNVFAALVLAFAHRVSGQAEVAVAAPAHNRVTRAFRETIGVFMELFPVRAMVQPEDSFRSLLGRVRAESAVFLRHARPGTSDPAVNRSLNIVLNYINATFPDFAGLATRSRWVHPGHGDSAHDLRVQVHDFDDDASFVMHLDAAADRFDARERALMGRHLLAFLGSVLEAPDERLTALSLIDPAERNCLAKEYSLVGLARRAVGSGSVVDRFLECVHARPHRVAVVSGATRWTYEDLGRRAGAFASALNDVGVNGGTVAMDLPRSADAVAAILGILGAGAAYVPLEPAAPPHRRRAILEAVGAVAAIVPDESARVAGLPCIAVSEIASEAPDGGMSAAGVPGAGDLAYVLFTSGSSGRPKGVAVEHGSLDWYATWAAGAYLSGDASAFALFTPLTFDLTVTSIFAPLVSGGSIVVYPDPGLPVDDAVVAVFEEDAVDVVKLTPSHLRLVMDRPETTGRIRTLVVGGEELRRDLAERAQALVGPTGRVVNEYGPTETTVACTWHRFSPGEDTGATVPIGRPIPGAAIAVVDPAGRLVPTGVAGEIVVGGAGVARGYLGDPTTSGDRFVTSPLGDGSRAYRTGDVGRWRPGGTLEYLGRRDRQVKIHGVRIEPAEIETVLAEHPGVTDCAVVATARPTALARGTRPDRACVECGLAAGHPDASLSPDGVCRLCRSFGRYRDRAMRYFGTMAELEELLRGRGARADAEADCLILLSGGKDSSYALLCLADMGLRVHSVTLDNGYISEGAKENVRRMTGELGVPHEFVSTPAMDEIFVDSLNRFSNVCQGCFKTMYTLAFQIALDRGIPSIVTGLSRGQFFETRLTEELFLGPETSREGLERVVLEARKAYHRTNDLVNRRLGGGRFDDDAAFDQVAFVDFYRYCDATLEQVLTTLRRRAPWTRPADTGRSSNCLINDVGIYVHARERGFHNYALPYSWDVRLGHKRRESAVRELDDDIDVDRVERILDRLGYVLEPHVVGGPQDLRLTAFVTGDRRAAGESLDAFLRARLPAPLVPSRFVEIDEIPRTDRGKVDLAALESMAARASRSGARPTPRGSPGAGPTTETEAALVELWQDTIACGPVGIDTDFFELGGDSIAAIRIAARGAARGLPMTPNDLFRHPTIRELARIVNDGEHPSEQAVGPVEPAATKLDRRTRDQVDRLLRRAHERSSHGELEEG